VAPLVPPEKTKKEHFDKVINVNLKGTFYVSQIFGKEMIERKAGRIISIFSHAALFGEKGFLSYEVSKAGIITMTRNHAFEWSQYGVTLCAIAPGFMAGGMNEPMLRKPAFVDYFSRKPPTEKMGTVEDLVATIVFLASPEASYINGETVVFDGGMTGYVQEALVDIIDKAK